MKATLGIAAALLASGPAMADLTVEFREGAPKDRFIIASTDCAIGPSTLTLDLTTSKGGLIFDTTAEGAGVEVFQPVELEQGAASFSETRDGDRVLQVSLDALRPGSPVTLTVDLDDTMVDSALGQIRVAGSEIVGATATLSAGSVKASNSFDETGQTRLLTGSCSS